jgi:HEAT repeat protein
MANDKDPLGRRWAMGELQKQAAKPDEKQKVVAALVTSAESDPFWRLRRAALSVLADIYSPDPPRGQQRPAAVYDANALNVMVRSLSDKQSIIRADATRHLGETKDPKYADRYLDELNDPSYAVIDEAAVALARTGDKRAFDALVKLTNTPSWKGRIQNAGLNALAELGDSRGFEVSYKIATDRSLPMNVRNRALTVVAATGKGDPRAFPLIFDKFKAAYATGGINALYGATLAIIKLADPRGQEAFDMLKQRYKDQGNILALVDRLETQFQAAIKK